jgi:protein gp37
MGVSVESNEVAWRADYLRRVPAAVRFISAEPLIGPLDQLDLAGLQWVTAGGETGRGHRPCDQEWVRGLRDRCVAEGVAFSFRHWGGLTRQDGGRQLDGRTWEEMPPVMRPETLPLPI